MIDTYFREKYQTLCVEPFLKVKLTQRFHPHILTCLACITGLVSALLISHFSFLAVFFLALSGYLDTLDGSLARSLQISSPQGAALDIISDRIVEFAILLGLFSFAPHLRALPCLLMLGSILICITSFLVVGIFTTNSSEKGFFYSPGLIERSEAFIFFSLMIAMPAYFMLLAYLFSGLVFLTAALRMAQFLKKHAL